VNLIPWGKCLIDGSFGALARQRRRKAANIHLARNTSAMMRQIMAEVNIIDEYHQISDRRGNGRLRREVFEMR